jgi:hypothetical protein
LILAYFGCDNFGGLSKADNVMVSILLRLERPDDMAFEILILQWPDDCSGGN